MVITKSEQAVLRVERYLHPHPMVQRKMETLWLKSQGVDDKTILRLASISRATLFRYYNDYREGGTEKLKEVNFHQPRSKLEEHRSSLEEHFFKNPPATVKQARDEIEKLTGIKRSETQVRRFLHKLGCRPRKIGMIPAKADAEQQEEFLEKKLNPVLDEAKNSERKVFFVDAAHFVLAPFLGFRWSIKRLFIKAPAGRKRFNVLGALDAITHELVSITNDTYINAQSVCDLLWALHGLHPNMPITLVLDNARYQKCKLVSELAERLGIDLLYLPPYSPNLNIIERLWKFVKKNCLYSKYYPDFDTFKQAISSCLLHTRDEHKKQLDTLLTLKFLRFDPEAMCE